MLKDKKVVLGIVLVIVVLLGGGYFVLGKQASKTTQTPETTQDETVEKLDPKEIGLDFMFRDDSKAGKIIIANAKDISAIEYQLSYQKEIDGENVPEGLIGEI